MITKLNDSSVKSIAGGATAIEYSSPQLIIAGGIAAYQEGGLLGLFRFAVSVANALLAP
ncbi:MAG TPA: hypothetical protein VFU82_06010 [Gammaproteobacteria bacterium]|jgi:hypothetical protein|nr:hypothetical protein [Gammaproteobacteria bacterium]